MRVLFQNGQAKHRRATAFGAVVEQNRALMRLDDLPHKGKPKPVAWQFGSALGMVQLLQRFRRKADSTVQNRQDAMPRFLLQRDLHGAAVGVMLHAVSQQIGNRALKQVFVSAEHQVLCVVING